MTTATTTCDIVGSSTICVSDTAQYFVSGFSYGEIIIILYLIMIFTLLFFAKIKDWIFGIKAYNYHIKTK